MRFKKSVSLLTAFMLVLSIFTPLADVFTLNANATSNNGRFSITSEASNGYGYISFGAGTDCSGFLITDNTANTTKRAFCIQHELSTPIQGFEHVTDYYEYPAGDGTINTMMLKALYYGYNGPKQWSGFANYNSNVYQRPGSYWNSYADKATMAGIYITSLTLSKYYNSSYDKWISGFDNYIKTATTPAYGKGYNSYTGKGGKTINSALRDTTIKTDTITFSVDVKNGNNKLVQATLTMPANVTGYNVTTGAKAAPGKKLVLNNGDKFYFSAPTSMANKKSTITGTLPKLYYYRTYITNNWEQNLATLEEVSGAKLSFTTTWEAPAYVKITKESTNNKLSLNNTLFNGIRYNLNATYGIYSSSSCTDATLVKTITTNNEGKSGKVQLNPGTYYLKERINPVDFEKNTTVTKFVVTAGSTTSVTHSGAYIVNSKSALNETPITGSLSVLKTGGDGTHSLGGAKFALYYNPKVAISNIKVTPNSTKQTNNIIISTSGTVKLAEFTIPSGTAASNRSVYAIPKINTSLNSNYNFITISDNTLTSLPKGYYAVVEMNAPTNAKNEDGTYVYEVSTEIKRYNAVNNISANFSFSPTISEQRTSYIKLHKDVDFEDDNKYKPTGAEYTVYSLACNYDGSTMPTTSSLYGYWQYANAILNGLILTEKTLSDYSINSNGNINECHGPFYAYDNYILGVNSLTQGDMAKYSEDLVNLIEGKNSDNYIIIKRTIMTNESPITWSSEEQPVAAVVRIVKNNVSYLVVLPRLMFNKDNGNRPKYSSWIGDNGANSGNNTDIITTIDNVNNELSKLGMTKLNKADFIRLPNSGDGCIYYDPEGLTNNIVRSNISTVTFYSKPYFHFAKNAVFTVNENGDGVVSSVNSSKFRSNSVDSTELQFESTAIAKNSIFYAKETKAPELYEKNNEPLFLTVDETGTGTFIFSDNDIAKMDPVNITISKASTLEDDENSLEGTIFKVAYYNKLYNSYETLSSEDPTRVWYLDTKVDMFGAYKSKLQPDYITNDPDYANKSSEFYYNSAGVPSLPYGTIIIEEVKAAEGFKLNSGTVTDGNVEYKNRKFIGQFKIGSDNELHLFSTNATVQTGLIAFTNELDALNLNISNKPDDLQFNFNKKFVDEDNTGELTERPGANISFNFTKYTESSTHELAEVNTVKITTDSNGNFTSVDNDLVNFEPGYVYRISEIKDNNSKTHQPIEDKYYRISSHIEIIEDVNNLVFTVEKLIVTIDDDTIKVATNDVIETIEVDARNADTRLFEYDLGTFYDYPNPVVSTTEFDTSTGMHISSAEGTVTIKDQVAWSYLKTNNSYVIKGILMEKKADGSVVPFKVNGNYILSTSGVFSPISKGDANGDGKLNVKDITYLQRFLSTDTFEQPQLKNDTIYQVLSNEKDPNYDSYVEQYGVLAKYVQATYSNIDIDNNGALDDHDLSLLRLSVNGWNIPLYEKSRYETSGIAELTFTFDSTKLTDEKTFVVYEYVFEGEDTSNLNVSADGVVDTTNVLIDNNGVPVTHANKDDIEQTGYIPKIGTTAQDKTSGTKLIFAKNNATLIDTVAYKNLEVTGATSTTTGRYVVVGKLFDTNTNKVIKTVAKQFKPTNMNDTIDVEFTFNANNYKGHTLVVYEYVYFEPSASEDAVHVRISSNKLSSDDSTVMYTEAIDGDISAGLYRSTFNTNGTVNSWTKLEDTPLLLAKHEDKTDVGQTIYIPEITTVVGDLIANTNGTYSITDTVNYTNLLKGHDYTLVAELRDTSGNLIATPSEITNFTISGTTNALQSSGSQDVTFTFDPTNIDTSKFVVYEYLYIGKFTSRSALDATKKVAEHTDKSDPNQTFSIGVPVSIEKRDADSGKILGGAVFEIRKADGTFVESWTSVAGQAHETKLLVGNYVLIETKAPKNYTIANPINFTVTNEKTITVNGQVLADNTVAMSDHILTSLPDAGGNGIIGFSVAGFATMLTSVILIYKKKKEE